MKKLLILAGAATALVVAGAPASAAPTPATSNANAHARIFRPLTIVSTRDMDLGTIILSGTGTFSDTVGFNSSGVFGCGANTTCSGTTQTAQYKVTGTSNRDVSITVGSTVAMVNQSITSPDLTLNITYEPGSVNLGSDGPNTGATFDIGGTIDVADTTAEGVYLGTLDVSADYQ